jgi:hypothetical protein
MTWRGKNTAADLPAVQPARRPDIGPYHFKVLLVKVLLGEHHWRLCAVGFFASALKLVARRNDHRLERLQGT